MRLLPVLVVAVLGVTVLISLVALVPRPAPDVRPVAPQRPGPVHFLPAITVRPQP